ncbi:MAG TPA: hypothetical protein PKM50_02400 [Methanoregula sp.]|nr:hypothetical protein [Methanoregula sp.]
MKRSPFADFMIVVCIFALAFAPGCTSRSGSDTPVQVPQTTFLVPSQVPATPTYSSTPGPVQTVPDYESVSVTVDRNTITENPTITTTFNGGMGLGMIEYMDVTVIRSDGLVETGHRDNPAMGTEVTLMGTTASDRVIVSVTMTSGDQYTIIDQYYPFPGSGNTG